MRIGLPSFLRFGTDEIKAAAKSTPAPPPQVHTPIVQDRTNRMISGTVEPRQVESILRAALLNGDFRYQAELFDIMEDTWPRLTKNLNEVKRAVSRINYVVNPACAAGGKPTPLAVEKAEFVRSVLYAMRPKVTKFERNTEGMLYDLLDAFGKGVSVVEVLWAATEKGIIPRAARQLPPHYIAFPSYGTKTPDEILYDPTGTYGSKSTLREFPEDNFLIGVCPARSGHPASTALLRSLAKYWIASQFGYQWLLNYAQMFGTPLRWATYDPQNKALLNDICAMLENMGNSSWGAFPSGTNLEIKEPSSRAGDNPQVLAMEIADKACDLLILGQTLTTDVGASGSRALGDVHMSVRADIMAASADWVAGVLNTQLIPTLLRLNYGDDSDAPTVAPDIKAKEDAKANAERDKILIGDLGLPVEKDWLYERHGIPRPAPDADPESIFTGKPATASSLPMPGAGSPPVPPDKEEGDDEEEGDDPAKEGTAKARESKSHYLVNARRAVMRDRLADEVMERLSGVSSAWLRPVRPVFASLIAKAQDSSVTDADFIAAVEAAAKNMPELFDRLDADALAIALEQAMGAAAVNGAVRSSRRS